MREIGAAVARPPFFLSVNGKGVAVGELDDRFAVHDRGDELARASGPRLGGRDLHGGAEGCIEREIGHDGRG